MPQDNPNVQVKNATPFGVQYSELRTDHNQTFGYPDDWRYSILQRLAFSPRLEVMVSDCLLWLSTSALATSLAGAAVVLGVPVVVVSWLGVLLLIPVGLWAIWVERNLDPMFKEITGLRLTLVLSGIALALAFGVWL